MCQSQNHRSVQIGGLGGDLVENVHEFCGADLHIVSGQLGKEPPELPDARIPIGLDAGVMGAWGRGP